MGVYIYKPPNLGVVPSNSSDTTVVVPPKSANPLDTISMTQIDRAGRGRPRGAGLSDPTLRIRGLSMAGVGPSIAGVWALKTLCVALGPDS